MSRNILDMWVRGLVAALLVLSTRNTWVVASGVSYVAAVFESSPNQTSAASAAAGLTQMMTTLASYKPVFADAAASGAEILVLNEMSISGFSFTVAEQVTPYLVELPSLGTVPCSAASAFTSATPTSQVLPALSCSARDLNMTFVVDLAERRACARIQAPCPARGYFQFNTQIVLLGGTGALASVYVKNHLFLPGNEGDIFDSAPWQPSYATFRSHTGRIFGQAVCFDLFYPNPILALAGMGVRDIVFSSYWENLKSYPLVTAASLQRAVSEAANVNLIGASVGYSWQNSGTGIYSQGRILNATFNQGATPRNTLVTAVVPSLAPEGAVTAQGGAQAIFPSQQLTSALPALAIEQERAEAAPVQPDVRAFTRGQSYVGNMTLVKVSIPAGASTRLTQAVVHEGIQCDFSITLRGGNKGTTLALIAQDGQYMVGAMRTQLCALQECPAGRCSLQDIPVPASGGITLQSGGITMWGFTAVRGLVAAIGPHGTPVDVRWAPWQQYSSFGVVSRGFEVDITGITLIGTFPYFQAHAHLP